MAGAAELAGPVEILHHRLGVTIKMREDLLIRNFASGDASPSTCRQ